MTDRERALDLVQAAHEKFAACCVNWEGQGIRHKKFLDVFANVVLEAEARGVERALKVIGSHSFGHSLLEYQAAELRAQMNGGQLAT